MTEAVALGQHSWSTFCFLGPLARSLSGKGHRVACVSQGLLRGNALWWRMISVIGEDFLCSLFATPAAGEPEGQQDGAHQGAQPGD